MLAASGISTHVMGAQWMPSPLGPVIGQYQDEFQGGLDGLPRYRLDVRLDDQRSTSSGRLEVDFRNATGAPIETVPFRLYPNAWYYDEGATEIAMVEVDDIAVPVRMDASQTVLFVDLPTTLDVDASITITIDFETVIPQQATGSYGILNHDRTRNRFVLADWYPIVAGWDETGWRLEEPTVHGDPTFAMTSLYDVTIHVPSGYEVIGTGEEYRESPDTMRIVTGPVRELAMVIGQDFAVQTGRAGPTTIHVYADSANQSGAERVLAVATEALSQFGELYGAYPFTELDLVETDLSLAYGVSWSGILFIDDGQMATTPERYPTLDFTVFHEIGHQWWGGTVGANSNDHTFMVEGLTNATAVLAQAARQGPAAAIESLMGWVVTPYLNLLDGSGDAVANVSIFDLPATSPISTLSYGKGALGFLAIRQEIGADVFDAALAAYADEFRLGIAKPADLQRAFEEAAGRSLDDLWAFWFDSADVTRADVEALVPDIIASLGTQQ